MMPYDKLTQIHTEEFVENFGINIRKDFWRRNYY